jgi:hypothetical protein
MSRKLKDTFNKKMDLQATPGFDSAFFKKLEKERKPNFFSRYLTWAISGCATLSVLAIAINTYHVTPQHSFNHKEYVETVIDLQSSFDDSVAGDYQTDMLDLTTPTEEI